MKLLLYSLNFFPELTGVGKYSGELASWLSGRGHDVRVISAPPYYPAWKPQAGYSYFRWTSESWRGVKIWRCPIWIPLRLSGAIRMLHLLSFALSSFPVVLMQIAWRPNVVIVVEPTLLNVPAALLLAKLCKSKSILHIQDFEIDAAFELGIFRGQWLRALVLKFESLLMQQFHAVSTISNRMALMVRKKKVENNKVMLFSNWVDITSFVIRNSEENKRLYREKLGIPTDKIVALYSGNMGFKQGLEILVDVAKRCNSDLTANQVYFVFCGNGIARDALIHQSKNLTNVKFLDLQPVDLFPNFLNMADLHLLPQRRDVADLVMPSKLTGMFASGRPVLVCANLQTELAEVVYSRGLVVPPENVEALYAGIVKLAQDANLRKTLGAAAKKYALENLEKNNVLCKFEKQLYHLVGK
jgi:colanic acid biosynthesis glycosyl transferase WcaI